MLAMQNSLEPGSRGAAPFLFIFGLGYSAHAIATLARTAGFRVVGTQRQPSETPDVVGFLQAEPWLQQATHVLSSIPPDQVGDPVLARYSACLATAKKLRWIGYLSTTGVYGDRRGGWVDEATVPAPESERGRRRVSAEAAWSAFATKVPVDIFRLAGIYGPGRSVFDDLRAGRARRVMKPGHAFGRIHRDDIAVAVLAAMQQCLAPRDAARILNLTDDLPAESAEVITEAAKLLGIAPPPAIPFAEAVATMSPMAQSFWADHRRVSSKATQAALGISWRYPTYREGLRAILAEEAFNGVTQQGQITGA